MGNVKTKEWDAYPVGTKVYFSDGKHWTRIHDGWQCCAGDKVSTPGDDWTIINEPFEIFKCFTGAESIDYQLDEWVAGRPVHNTKRDECCPDFSCCQSNMMALALREDFKAAHLAGVTEVKHTILGMGLTNLFADKGKEVHIAGEDVEHH